MSREKKTEIATREALAILESDGMTNCSKSFDSLSATDQDRAAPSEAKDVEEISNGTYPRLNSAAGEEDDPSTMGSGSEKNLHEKMGLIHPSVYVDDCLGRLVTIPIVNIEVLLKKMSESNNGEQISQPQSL